MWASLFLQSKDRERRWDLSLPIQTQHFGQVSSFRDFSLLCPCQGLRIVLSLPMFTGVHFDLSNCGTEIQLWSQFLAPRSRLRTFIDTNVPFSVGLFSGDNGGEGETANLYWKGSSLYPLRHTLWCAEKAYGWSVCSWSELQHWCGCTLRAFNRLQYEHYPLVASVTLLIS